MQKFHIGAGWQFLTGGEEDIKLVAKKLGLSSLTDLSNRDGHMPSLMIGNEPTSSRTSKRRARRWSRRRKRTLSPPDDPCSLKPDGLQRGRHRKRAPALFPLRWNTVAGVPDVSGSDDGPVASAHLLSPTGLVFPFAGDNVFYVGDLGSTFETSYGLLRRVSIFEDAVTTVAGAVHGAPRIEDGLASARFSTSRGASTATETTSSSGTPRRSAGWTWRRSRSPPSRAATLRGTPTGREARPSSRRPSGSRAVRAARSSSPTRGTSSSACSRRRARRRRRLPWGAGAQPVVALAHQPVGDSQRERAFDGH